ncbi:hypothetical protein ACHAW5_008461 [Stephanodiscus triporus]|uniref:SET domain-containing protein n=1 Tax=Stephanodiscus triporus TaxID=2934178 RepID=A0ABD3P2Y0_9STRA
MTSPSRGLTLSAKIQESKAKRPRGAMVRRVLYSSIFVRLIASCGILGYTTLGVLLASDCYILASYRPQKPQSSSLSLKDGRMGTKRWSRKPEERMTSRGLRESVPDPRQGRPQKPQSSSLSLEDRWSRKPEKWERMTLRELRRHFACHAHARDQTKALPTLEEWTFLKRQYKELVDDKPVILESPVPPTEGYSFGPGEYSDTPPPYYAGHTEGKGRGLFSSRPIKKGELVHDGPRSNVKFPDAAAFRRLVVSLPRKTACDITEWAWTQKLSPDGTMSLFVDLNIAALMNSSEEPNVAPKNETTTRFYATRDIAEGEEIVYDYDVYETDWSAVGLE